MTTQETPAKKPKAKLIGIIVGIVVFLMMLIYNALTPNYVVPPTSGSSVVVRPIRKDDNVKRGVYAIVIAAAAGYLTTRHLRQRAENKNPKA